MSARAPAPPEASPRPHLPSSLARHGLELGLLTIVCAITLAVGLRFSLPPLRISPMVLEPALIAVYAAHRGRLAAAAALVLSSALDLGVGALTDRPLYLTGLFVLTKVVVIGAGAAVLITFQRTARTMPSAFRHVWWQSGVTAVVAASLGALTAQLLLNSMNPTTVIAANLMWWGWFTAAALGFLLVIPLHRFVRWRPWRELQAQLTAGQPVVHAVFALALTWAVFALPEIGEQAWRQPALVLIPLVLAALRLHPATTVAIAAAVALQAIWFTDSAVGPLVQGNMSASLMSIQVFTAIVLIVPLIIAESIRAELSTMQWISRQANAMSQATGLAAFIDDDGRYQNMSTGFAAALGFQPQDLLGRPLAITLHPDDVGLVNEQRERARADGFADVHLRFVTQDGTVADKEVMLVNEMQGLAGLHLFARPISERQQSNLELTQFFDLSFSLECLIDGNLRIKRANPSWRDLLRYDPEDLVDRSFSDLCHSDDLDEVRRLTAMFGQDAVQDRVQMETRVRAENGEYRMIHWQMARSPSAELVYAAGHDVTDQREAERSLAEARDSALVASTIKSRFLATMSHEIRTPMNGVIGLGDLLALEDLTPTQRSHVDGIRSAGTALMTVINDILDFSKIESGRFALDSQDFTLADLVSGVERIITPIARQRGLEFVISIDPSVNGTHRGDVGRLRQVLLNLLGNAVKFTETGRVTLEVGPCPDADGEVGPGNRHHLLFQVLDTGSGMDPETLGRVFEPFIQGDNSARRSHGGTGLGLAITRQIVEAMGGTVTAMSVPRVGSRFIVDLPLAEPVSPSTSDPRRSRRLEGTGRLDAVLVVADESEGDDALDRMGQLCRHVELVPARIATQRLIDRIDQGLVTDVVVVELPAEPEATLELVAAMASTPHVADLPVLLLTDQELPARVAALPNVYGRLDRLIREEDLLHALTWDARRASATRSLPRGARVLVVEDNEVNQMVARSMLQELGLEVGTAGNGQVGVEMATREPWDLVLMDCQMPVLDGYQATHALRADSATRDLPIVAMTANAFLEDRERCLAAGMSDYISKPVRMGDLRATLLRWLSSPPGGEQPAAGPGAGEPITARQEVLPVGVAAPATSGSDPDPRVLAMIEQVQERLAQLAEETAPALVVQITDSFLAQLPGSLEAILDAATSGQSQELAFAAHSLRGAAGNIGAGALFERCSEIELTARTDRPQELQDLIEGLTELIDSTAVVVREVRSRLALAATEA